MSRISKNWLPTYFESKDISSCTKKVLIKHGNFNPTFRLLQDGKIPRLQHGLNNLLTKPRGTITGIKQGFESIQRVPKITHDQLSRIQSYTPPSQDANLLKALKKHHIYMGSTSTVTGMLSQIYFCLSGKRNINTSDLSQDLVDITSKFTQGASSPCTIVLRRHGSTGDAKWSIDADKSFDSPNILSSLGHVLEYRLTNTHEKFQKLINNQEKAKRESFNLLDYKSLLIRSQLDCYNKNLDNKFFDLKTRAVLSIRLCVSDYKNGTWYKIIRDKGQFLSYEREYYDMIRSAFLKYYFQVCIGNMDGIFVAYHNTNEIFGFQYISRSELAYRVFGSSGLGEAVFGNCIQILEKILEELTSNANSNQLLATLHYDKDELSVFNEVVPDNFSKFNFKKLVEPEKSYSKESLKHFTVNTDTVLNGKIFSKSTVIDRANLINEFTTEVEIANNTSSVVEIASRYRKIKSIEQRVKSSINLDVVNRLRANLEQEVITHTQINKN
eukprot:NODE_269_length_12236_cov_0.516932.p3 type:complete len:498 gc:universal NODE_269_length_12236_cov_0.516932:9831-8338(-)